MAELQASAGPERVGHWLYPLSGTGRRFTTATGSFAAEYRKLRNAALSGAVREGSGPFERGFLTVANGDLLWLHDPVGIVGLARVIAHSGRPSPTVTFRVERGPTRVLVQDPVPASLLRRWLRSSPRQPVELSHDNILTEGLVWWLDQLDARDRHRLEPIDVPTLREVAMRHRDRLDDATVAATVRALRSRDLAVGLPTGKTRAADVVARNGDRLVVCRIVREFGDRGRRTVLESLGGLAWYGRSLADAAPRLGLRPDLWLVFTQAPSDDLVRFLEDEGRSVAWQEGAELRLSAATMQRWPLSKAQTRPASSPSARHPRPRLVIAEPPAPREDAEGDDGHGAWAEHPGALDDHDHDHRALGIPSVLRKPRDPSGSDALHRESG